MTAQRNRKRAQRGRQQGRALLVPALLAVLALVFGLAACHQNGAYAQQRETSEAQAVTSAGIGGPTAPPGPAPRPPRPGPALTQGAALGDIADWFDSPLGKKVRPQAN